MAIKTSTVSKPKGITGRLCLYVTQAGLTACAPHWGRAPPAPTTAPHHDKHGLPAPCWQRCQLLRTLPSALLVSPYGWQTAATLCPGYGLPAQQSPGASLCALLTLMGQRSGVTAASRAQAGDQDLPELFAVLQVLLTRSQALGYFVLPLVVTQSCHMCWSNQCNPLLVLREQPKLCTRIGIPGCQTGNYHPQSAGLARVGYELYTRGKKEKEHSWRIRK